jgi:hypothetical protein
VLRGPVELTIATGPEIPVLRSVVLAKSMLTMGETPSISSWFLLKHRHMHMYAHIVHQQAVSRDHMRLSLLQWVVAQRQCWFS